MSRVVTFTGTHGFKVLERDSRTRNRGPNREFLDRLDPKGIHVVAHQMIHNDVELRCRWLCKLVDEDKPVGVWMDNGFEAFDQMTETETLSGKAEE